MYITTASAFIGIIQEGCIQIRLATESLERTTNIFYTLENTKNGWPRNISFYWETIFSKQVCLKEVKKYLRTRNLQNAFFELMIKEAAGAGNITVDCKIFLENYEYKSDFRIKIQS